MDDSIRRTPSIMKDCVRKYYHEEWKGDPTSHEAHKIVPWLVLEFHRMRLKNEEVLDKMVIWAEQTYPNISLKKLETLKRYVITILKNPYELGFPRKKSKIGYQSVLSDICFRDGEGCLYYDEFNRIRQNLSSLKINESNYHRYGWPEYLREKYGGYGIYADLIYQIYRLWESEHNIPAGEKLCIGYREMTKRIQFIRRGAKPFPMEAFRATRILNDVGLIRIVEHGKRRGDKAFSQPRANGYRRVIPIPKPEERTD